LRRNLKYILLTNGCQA